MRFAVVNLFGVPLAAVGWTSRPFEIAHLTGVATSALSGYFLDKHHTFA